MLAILIAIGSHGDVHPFVGMGIELRRRGHRVIVGANESFAPLIQSVGLEFAQLGGADDFRRAIDNPDIWHPTRGFRHVMAIGLKPLLRPAYDLVASNHIPGDTVVATSTLGLGARVAQDRLGVPTASVHLQPAVLRTVYAMPKLPGMPSARWLPKSMRRGLWWLADALVVNRAADPPVNALRKEVGLPPIVGAMSAYLHSPQRIIALFPEWFCPTQPDFPQQLRMVGFPLYDERGSAAIMPNLEEFLATGDAPVAFTPGSANVHGRTFFDAGVAACTSLGLRALLLTRHRQQIPDHLPARALHVDFAPFSELLPRCAALVHHGGIGTMSQALAAGIPQVVMPLSHDQFDNARRAQSVGAAVVVSARRFATQIAPALAGVLASHEISANCREVARRFDGVDAIGEACTLIEQLRGTDGQPFGPANRGAMAVGA